MSEKKETKVRRPYCLTDEDLKAHFLCVADAIKKDADALSKDANRTRSIEISASIEPMTEVTIVTYSIERNADPRIKREDNGT